MSSHSETIKSSPLIYTRWSTIFYMVSSRWPRSSSRGCLSFNLTLIRSGGKNKTLNLTSASTSSMRSSSRTGAWLSLRSGRTSKRSLLTTSFIRSLQKRSKSWRRVAIQCRTRRGKAIPKDCWNHRSWPGKSCTQALLSLAGRDI